MKRRSIISSAVFVIAPLPAFAHDFWIEPSSFRPAPGAHVKVALRVGENFKGEPVVRNREKIERFVVVGPDGEQPVPGQDGADPAGVVRPGAAGSHVLGYRSKESRIELEAEKFEAYLREEGLESIIGARKDRGESSQPGKERYSRCAKALIAAGDAPDHGFDRALGFTLELVPQVNPYASGDRPFPVRILYEGKPLAGAQVVAMNREEPAKTQSAKSSADGLVEFTLTRPGVWMIKSVHMIRAPAGADVDWTSYWATLTFERP